MYRSTHHPQANLTGSTIGTFGTTRLPGAGSVVKKQFAEFGPKGNSRPQPGEFLKSGQRCTAVVPTSNPSGFKYNEPLRKPNVPRREEKPVLGLKTNKNFITSNAVDVILQVPQRQDNQEANYLSKPDYGKVPEYLNQVKEEIQRENRMIDEYVAEMGRVSGVGRGNNEEEETMDAFNDNERAELLMALKKKWDSVNAKYQTMCHQVKLDTVGKVKRKETLEKELDLLEADIKKLASRGPVYVSTN